MQFLAAQGDEFAHPELEWRTIETEHFLIHFHRGTEWTANRVAKIAEEIYHPITDLYQHRPDTRVNIIIRDHDDYSNGAAYFYDNKIEIWAPALDFELRGTHPWLENVVTHEFTHIVQIQTAMKFGRKVPAIYLQWLGYEAERRPDVLYGFPNIIASYPLSAFVIPTWFAEGVAQYNHPSIHHDTWDTHRDMMLRMAVVDDALLSWEEMAVFGKNSLGNESAYNAGYAFVEYLAEMYGAEKLREVSQSLGTLHRITIDGALRAVYGIPGIELYETWKQSKRTAYQAVVAAQGSERVEGKKIPQEGFGNFYPTFSPDGNYIAFVSTANRDYFSQSSLYLYDIQSNTVEQVVAGVRSSLSFSPDGRYLYYAKATRANSFWSRLYDLYRYDLQEKEERRLTHHARAMNPKISNDGTKVVYVVNSDGSSNIAVADALGENARQLTRFGEGEQVFTPVWSPDGRTIAFGFSDGHRQHVATIDTSGQTLEVVVADADARNPCYSSDGAWLYYSSDRTGVFNLYRLHQESGVTEQVTNVIGGAFLPSVSRNGAVVFASYTSAGYKTVLLSPDKVDARRVHMEITQDAMKSIASKQKNSDESKPQQKEYRNTFTSLSLVPFLRVDNYNPRNKGIDVLKPGLFFSSTEMLGKLTLFGGAAVNRKLERDLFLVFEYRDRFPLLYSFDLDPALSIEVYNSTRTTESILDLTPYLVPTEITYNLLEFDAFLTQRFITESNELKVGFTLSRYSADIGSFYNPNDNARYSAFRSTYLIANVWSLQLRHHGILPSGEAEINPIGQTLHVRYAYERNRFNPEGNYDVRNGLLVPVYTQIDFHRIEGAWSKYIELPFQKHTLSMSVRGGSILGRSVDDFFDFYAGGFTGMRGYPYYAIGGNETMSINATYRFPLWRTINTRVLQFYFTKLYGSLYTDLGDAWNGNAPPLARWKTDAGFELRLEAFSFYAYPTRIFFSGAYGFDRFTRTINNVQVTYGREWRFYLGVLFGFEINQIGKVFSP